MRRAYLLSLMDLLMVMAQEIMIISPKAKVRSSFLDLGINEVNSAPHHLVLSEF